MMDYKRALDCLNYLTRFVNEIENKNSGGTGIMFDKDGEIIMRTDIGYWEEGNIDLRGYLMNKTTTAIPVEWIKKWKNKQHIMESICAIEWLLADWEKENEISVMPVSDNSTIPLDYLGGRK